MDIWSLMTKSWTPPVLAKIHVWWHTLKYHDFINFIIVGRNNTYLMFDKKIYERQSNQFIIWQYCNTELLTRFSLSFALHKFLFAYKTKANCWILRVLSIWDWPATEGQGHCTRRKTPPYWVVRTANCSAS